MVQVGMLNTLTSKGWVLNGPRRVVPGSKADATTPLLGAKSTFTTNLPEQKRKGTRIRVPFLDSFGTAPFQGAWFSSNFPFFD